MIELNGVSKRFGGVQAVDELTIKVKEGEIFGLIGPNGSGKSTTVNLISGIYPVTSGSIRFDNNDITGKVPHQTLVAGIARTFQNIRLFPNLTVWQNLWVAQNGHGSVSEESFFSRWFGGSKGGEDSVRNLLDFSELAHRANELAGNLAFGEQRRLELARALAAKPKMLLLDEPAAGMNLEEVQRLGERLRALKQDGMTILLVEHVMELVMNNTDRIAVLNLGRIIAEGTPNEIQKNEEVRAAYLGSGADRSMEKKHA